MKHGGSGRKGVVPTWRVAVMDDRGARVPLFNHDLVRSTEASDRIHAALHRAPRRLSRGEKRRFAVVAAVVAVCTPAAFPLFGYVGRTPLAGFWAIALFLVPFVAICLPVFVFAVRWMAKDRLVAAMVSVGYCASCGFDLTATPTDGDGCRTCPECGAGWRIDARESPDRAA